jgi:PAB-dependent poly(A)-specific ribonuclease subunit 2
MANNLVRPKSKDAHYSIIHKGRVMSFFGPDLQKYTSFKAHLSTEGAIRQLLFNDRGVISIAAKSVHMSLRRGLAQWNIV